MNKRAWAWLALPLFLAGCARNDAPAGSASKPAGYAPASSAFTQPQAAPAQPVTTEPAAPAPDAAPSAMPTSAGDSGADRSSPFLTPSKPAARPQESAAAVVPKGTRLVVRTDASLSTRANRAGDSFTATLVEPVVVGGRTAIPKGTLFTGHVTTSAPSGRLRGRAALGLRLDSFRLGGKQYRVETAGVTRVSGDHRKRNGVLMGGGAGLGALLGAIAGGGRGALIGAGAGAAAGTAGALVTGRKQAALPAEALLRFSLQAPVAL
jgi:hypothetical protein